MHETYKRKIRRNINIKQAKITRGLDETKYGKITKIEFPDKSLIYISKRGWTLVLPDKQELSIPYGEINIAIKESVAQGYVIKKSKEIDK